MSRAEPMGWDRRMTNYCGPADDLRRLTPAQWRRLRHKERRALPSDTGRGAKGRPTPRRVRRNPA